MLIREAMRRIQAFFNKVIECRKEHGRMVRHPDENRLTGNEKQSIIWIQDNKGVYDGQND